MKRYFWSGICNQNRTAAFSEITSVVDRFATMLNFQRFSDISLGLLLETAESRLSDLYNNLTKIMSMEVAEENFTNSKDDCIFHLHITFTKKYRRPGNRSAKYS